MANLRDIRRRIRSIKNTAQITRAMQLVAASKMKRAQDTALQNRPYAQLLMEMLATISANVSEIKHPFLEERPVKRRGILILSTDKGLCGALNANLFRMVTKLEGEVRFVTVGRKATQFISRTQRHLLADFSVPDKMGFGHVRPISEFLMEQFRAGEIDTIEVLYPKFVNTLRQDPMLVRIVPLTELAENLNLHGEDYTTEAPIANDEREIKFEPAPEAILEQLIELYIRREIYHLVLEAKASEHSARMVAMKTATDNAKKLVEELTLEYNKVRQAAITQEILEIAAATSADH